MTDKFILYKDIFDGNEDMPERKDPNPSQHDSDIIEDLAINFQIKELNDQKANFDEIHQNKINALKNKLHFTYNGLGERTDYEASQLRSKNILENIQWKKEITLINEKDKIATLKDINQKRLIVDSIRFLDEDDKSITCLSSTIGEVDQGCDEDESPCIFVIPELILNATGNVEFPDDEDMSLEVDIDQIQEIICSNTKYTFLS